MSIEERIQLEKVTEEEIFWLTEIAKNAYMLEEDPRPSAPRGIDSIKQHTKFIDYWDYYKIGLGEYTAGGIMVAKRGEEHCELISIFIDPEYQQQGFGTEALRKVLEIYPAKIWTLGAYYNDDTCMEFFKSNGFNVVGVTFNEKLEKINWMERELGPFSPLKIGELEEGQGNVFVEGRITEKADARAVRGRRPGQSLSVADAGFEDESGRIVLTLWNEQIRLIQEGDRCRIENGYVGAYRGVKQLSGGKSGHVIKLNDR
jgi:ribosomal protein S18 acetylase RimI-like enzyme